MLVFLTSALARMSKLEMIKTVERFALHRAVPSVLIIALPKTNTIANNKLHPELRKHRERK